MRASRLFRRNQATPFGWLVRENFQVLYLSARSRVGRRIRGSLLESSLILNSSGRTTAAFFGKDAFNVPFPLPARRIWDRHTRILLKKSCAICLRDEKSCQSNRMQFIAGEVALTSGCIDKDRWRPTHYERRYYS